MKELQEIVKAYDEAVLHGFKAALATVVQVEGSAYRHEGARMLIREDGNLTGAISGGCLEGDALRKALSAINQNRKILVTYDTTDEDDATVGVGLGCNGIIHVLIEPLQSGEIDNPIDLFKRFLIKRQTAVLGTFFSLEDKLAHQEGTCMLLAGSDTLVGKVTDQQISEEFRKDSVTVLQSGQSVIKHYNPILSGFIEVLTPPVHVLVFGAGNDTIPLVQFASILGWETSVIDGRSNYATALRFPLATRVTVSKPEKAFSEVMIDEQTVAVLMTHNYNYDIAILRQCLNLDLKYIGALGPAKKLQRMLEELSETVSIPESKLRTIFGPTGLDIGSETPEEIALSIIAEIKAVLAGRNGTSLRFRDPRQTTPDSSRATTKSKFSSCSVGL